MPCVDDVMSPWQHDAGDESLMTPLRPAVIPTVVESEHVTDDDDEWRRLDVPAAAAVHQYCVNHITHHDQHAADRPLTVEYPGTSYSAFTRTAYCRSLLHS